MQCNAALNIDFNPEGQKRCKPRKYVFTEHMDNLIRDLYRNKYSPCHGRVAKLAVQLNIPRWMVSRRALEINVLEPHIKEPEWTKQELHILELNALRTPVVIQRKLKLLGYHRSIYGIMLKRKRLRLTSQQIKGSARAVAECFGVDASTVADQWIRKGLLKATRRGTARTAQQGGDEWFIKERDIREFIIDNVGIIDFRKVDKFWLVNVLTGGKSL
jgi:hypothetical protein